MENQEFFSKIAESQFDGHLFGRQVIYYAVRGSMGAYLIAVCPYTDQILRDDRPWKMKKGGDTHDHSISS